MTSSLSTPPNSTTCTFTDMPVCRLFLLDLTHRSSLLIALSDEGWKAFMSLFLQSIQPIVPDPGSMKTKSSSSSSSSSTDHTSHKGIPTAFVEEIETLRTRVEELSDEVRPDCCCVPAVYR